MGSYDELEKEFNTLQLTYEIFKDEYARLNKHAIALNDDLTKVVATVVACDVYYKHLNSKFEEFKKHYSADTLYEDDKLIYRMLLFIKVLKKTNSTLVQTQQDMNKYFIKHYYPYEQKRILNKIYTISGILLITGLIASIFIYIF